MLGAHLRRNHADNRGALERLGLLFRLASSLLTLEIVIWVLAIAEGG
jgi:hypothetical protein